MKKHSFKQYSITQKLVIMLILIILPFNIVSIISNGYSLKNARQQTVSSMENIAGLAVQQLDSRLAAMNDFFYNLGRSQPDFQLYLKQGERNAALAIAESSLAHYFSTIAENSAFADVMFWQSTEYDKFYIGMDSLQNPKNHNVYQCKAILREFLETDQKLEYTEWKMVEIEGMLWVLKVYVQEGFYYGSMISLDEIAYNLQKSSVYSSLDIQFETKEEETDQAAGMLCTSSDSRNSNIRMGMRVPEKEGYANLSAFQLLCIGFIFLYLLLIPILIYLIHRMVLRPLKEIRGAMEHLRSGEQDYRIPVTTETAEFMEMEETFNSMADRIKELRIANYEKELERQRVELRNLQLQIRPHFLMNMFNLLYSFAQIESYQSIQKLALYLSEYFRYLFQSGKDLQPFSRELDLIQKYMEIAALRSPNCCETVYEIDPEAMDVEIPPLLVHNFVENIFKHAVNSEKTIHLRIEAYTDDQEATIMIADDGPGMDPRMVEDINHGIFRRQEDRVHVGIENSWRRIQYFYGGKGSLTVESALGEGTCFTILIPIGGDEG
ncbi:MAG: histidine kinase [Candidatus Limivivens sp.]|nr:histidine kinase [Candidatus Limivivens sp.]